MKQLRNIIIIFLILPVFISCEKMLEIAPPTDSLSPANVFTDSATVNTAVLGLYSKLFLTSTVSSGDINAFSGAIGYMTSLYTDEMKSAIRPTFEGNALTPTTPEANFIWRDAYNAIYNTNLLIEQVTASAFLTESMKNKSIAEARFLRAFCYFHLVNIYGNVPLVLISNPVKSATIPRTPVSDVYIAIQDDLNYALDNLPANFSLAGGDRSRVSKFAAQAFLSRIYLYTSQWEKAEAMATELIKNSNLFSLYLGDQKNTFLKSSTEAIFQIDSKNQGYTFEARYYVPQPGVQPSYILTDKLMNTFELGDLRKAQWISEQLSLPYPAKYKVNKSGGVEESDALFRLAEQYLIRSEARIQQDKFSLAKSDLDALRNSRGLGNSTAMDKPSLLLALEQENNVEFFAEWGHRFYDLKRWGRIDAVMKAYKPGIWKSQFSLFPISQEDIGNNGNLKPNPGY